MREIIKRILLESKIELIEKISKYLNISHRGMWSNYGKLDSVFIRISDHLPSTYKIFTHKKNINEDKLYYYFIIVTDDEYDEDELEDQYNQELSEYYENKEISTMFSIFEKNENFDNVRAIIDRNLNIIKQ